MVYLCLIAYVVAIYVRPSEVVPSLAAFPLVELLAAVTMVVAGFSYLARPRKFWDLPHDKFVLGIWLAIILSNLSWGWFGGALLGFSDFLKVAFYYFLMRFAIRDARQFQGFVTTVIVSTVFIATTGVIQHHIGVGLGGVQPLPDGRIRGTGIFNDPNDLAMALVMVVPFLLDDATDRAQRFMRRFMAAALLLPVVTALFYTNSRGGMVGLAAVLVAQAFRRFGRITGAAAAALLLAAVIALGPSRLSMLSTSEESAQERIVAWAAALQMFKSDPLFGVGYNRFTEFHERVAHNSFVHTFAELGIVGAFFFVGLCYWLLKGILSPSPTNAPIELERWRKSVLASSVGVLTSACFLSQQYGLVLYTLVGMGACHTALARAYGAHTDLKISVPAIRNILFLTAGGIVVTYLSVRLFARWSGA